MKDLLERVRLFLERDDATDARYSLLSDAELAEAIGARSEAAAKEGDEILRDVKAALASMPASETKATIPDRPTVEFSISIDKVSDTPLNCDRNATRWAREFNEVLAAKGVQPLDPGWLIGWFANAMMCGEDTYRWRQEAKAQSASGPTSEDEACKVAATLLRNEIVRLEYPKSMFPQEAEKIGRRQTAFQEAIRFLEPASPDSAAKDG